MSADCKCPEALRCTLAKRTRVQNTTEEFVFGQEVVTESKVAGKNKKVLMTSDHPGHLVITTVLLELRIFTHLSNLMNFLNEFSAKFKQGSPNPVLNFRTF